MADGDNDVIPGPSPPVFVPYVPPFGYPEPPKHVIPESNLLVSDPTHFVGTWQASRAGSTPDPNAFPIIDLQIHSDTTWLASLIFPAGGFACTRVERTEQAMAFTFAGAGWGNGDNILSFAQGLNADGDMCFLQLSLMHYPNNVITDGGGGVILDPVIQGHVYVTIQGACFCQRTLAITLRQPT